MTVGSADSTLDAFPEAGTLTACSPRRPDPPSFSMTDVSSWTYTSQSETDTVRLGERLARVLEPGTVVPLVGELGAGKTRFVQAVAAAMGVDRSAVASPTFVLLQEYEGRLPIYHFDAYRIGRTDEFLQLGAEELMEGDGVCFIEWADRVADVLPQDRLQVEIEIAGRTKRVFRFTATGPRAQRILQRLTAPSDD